jgi:serine/threonine protein kinase/formylglycine-generating enzyme required for sulfatase activity
LNENEWLGRRMLELGWSNRGAVAAAFEHARSDQGRLHQILLQAGQLTASQAQQLDHELALFQSQGVSRASSRVSHSSARLAQGQRQSGRLQNSYASGSRVDHSRLKRVLSSGQVGALKDKVLGPFCIVRELTRGGMGIVLEAEHIETKARVALKLMLSDDPSSEARQRFEREARTLSKLDHPRIVKVVEFGHEEGIPWFAMELISGQTLEEYVLESLKKRGSVPEFRETAAAFTEIAEGLLYCHEQHVIHRDLKPSNIIIEKQSGRPVLLDFGLVKRDPTKLGNTFKELELTVTVAQEGVGTPAFMSPEQLDPRGEFGPISDRADVWGLAATLFFCLTGETPYGGRSTVELYAALATQEVRDARTVNKEIPRWLGKLCSSGMTKLVADRPGLADWLQALRDGGPKKSRVKELIYGVWALMVLVALTIVFVYGLKTRDPLKLEELKLEKPHNLVTGQYWTSQEQLKLAGTMNWGPVSVSVGKMTFQSDRNGRFTGLLRFKEGKNVFQLSAGQGAGQIDKEIVILHDKTAPRLILDGRKKGQSILIDKKSLKGSVKDLGACILQADGIEIEVKGGLFSIDLKSKNEMQKVNLLATDLAGNKTQQSWQVWTKPALKNLAKKRLLRRKIWNITKIELQDFIIEYIGQRLGAGYKWLHTKIYKGPSKSPLSHRLATYLHIKTGLELQLLPGDRYRMGTEKVKEEAAYVKRAWRDPIKYIDLVSQESPAHNVEIPPFLMGRHEVTQEQWDIFKCEDSRLRKDPKSPIESTSRKAVKKWLKLAKGRLRLASESEWEYACRAGTTSRFYWGQEINYKCVWNFQNSQTRPRNTRLHDKEGSYNAFGLVDMAGNVAEWCEDPFTPNYKDGPFGHRAKIIKNPVFSLAVVRGGSVRMKALFGRSAARDYAKPNIVHPHVGFRVVRSLP